MWIGLWAACNLALGIVLAYPLLLLTVIGLHTRAMLFHRSDSPFSNNEIQGGEAVGFIPFGILLAVLILAVVTGINWPLIRRLRLPSAASKGGIVAVTGALLIAPVLLMF